MKRKRTTRKFDLDSDVVIEKLENVNIKTQYRDSKHKKKFKLTWQFAMGRMVNAFGARGFAATRHNIWPCRGVNMTNVECNPRYTSGKSGSWKLSLWNLGKKILLEYDPEYARNDDYVMQIAKMVSSNDDYVRPHVDGRDVSYQLVTTLGDFTGGEIQTWHTCDVNANLSEMQCHSFDTKGKLLKIDGRYVHRVAPFQGTRYSIIFYKLYDRNICTPVPKSYPPSYIM